MSLPQVNLSPSRTTVKAFQLPCLNGKVERGVGHVQDNTLRGRHFGSLARRGSSPLAVGNAGGRPSHPWRHAPAGPQGLRGAREAGALAPAGPAFSLPPGRAALGASRCARGSGEGLLLGPARICGPQGCGGTHGWCASTTCAWSRSPCTCARSRADSAPTPHTLALECRINSGPGATLTNAWSLACSPFLWCALDGVSSISDFGPRGTMRAPGAATALTVTGLYGATCTSIWQDQWHLRGPSHP